MSSGHFALEKRQIGSETPSFALMQDYEDYRLQSPRRKLKGGEEQSFNATFIPFGSLGTTPGWSRRYHSLITCVLNLEVLYQSRYLAKLLGFTGRVKFYVGKSLNSEVLSKYCMKGISKGENIFLFRNCCFGVLILPFPDLIFIDIFPQIWKSRSRGVVGKFKLQKSH